MSRCQTKEIMIDGIAFGSKKTAKVYQELKLLERDGRIKDLSVQHKFELQPAFKKNGEIIRSINYIADFVFFDFDLMRNVVMDAKEYNTEVCLLKKRMFEYKYPELTILEV